MATLTQTEFIQGPVTPGGQPLTASDIGAGAVGTTQLAANAVTGAKMANTTVTATQLASGAVTKAKAAVFYSAQVSTTGSAQNVAHGLGVTPSVVLVVPTDGATVTYGSHTTTNVVFTGTTGKKVDVFAWA